MKKFIAMQKARKRAKVKVWFKVKGDHYVPIKYRTRTVEIELPVDRYGFTETNKITGILSDILSPQYEWFKVTGHQIISVISA